MLVRTHGSLVMAIAIAMAIGCSGGPDTQVDASSPDAPAPEERCDGTWTITLRGGADGCGKLFGNVPDAPDFEVAATGAATSTSTEWTMASATASRTASGCELSGTATASVPNAGAGGTTEWTLTFSATASGGAIDGTGDAEGRLVGGAGSGRCSTVVLFSGSLAR